MIRDQEILDQLVYLVDRFVKERLIQAEQQVAEDLRIPDDIVRKMKDLGLFGMTIPEGYGGLGLTMEEEIHVAMKLGLTIGLLPRSESVLNRMLTSEESQ